MKHIFIFLFLLSFINSSAQKVNEYYDFFWKPCQPKDATFYNILTKTDSGFITNDYFISESRLQMSGFCIDSACKIKNGYFTYYYANGIMESKGNYINNKKNGSWIGFHSNGMYRDSTFFKDNEIIGTQLLWHSNGFMSDSLVINEDGSSVNISWFDNGVPSSAGFYSTGYKKNKIWVYYRNNGTKCATETYKEGELIKKVYFDENEIENGDTIFLESKTEFIGGIKAWVKYLNKKLYFPKGFEIINTDNVKVGVTFSINEEGKVDDINVSIPFHPEFDKIVKKIIENSPKWKPAINNNRKVKSYYGQIVNFAQIE